MEDKVETLYKLLELSAETTKEEMDEIVEMVERAGDIVFENFDTVKEDTFYYQMKAAFWVTMSDASLLDLKRRDCPEEVYEELVSFNDMFIVEGEFTGVHNVKEKLLYDFSRQRKKFNYLTPVFLEIYLDYTSSHKEYILPYLIDKSNELVKDTKKDQ